jgi:hypothetical protein
LTGRQKSRRPVLSDWTKASVKIRADEFVESVLQPKHVKPPPAEMYNYIVDIYTRWRGNQLSFCAKYRSQRSDDPDPFFETRFARMEYLGRDRFALSFLRHNREWIEPYSDLTLDEGLESIGGDFFFIP